MFGRRLWPMAPLLAACATASPSASPPPEPAPAPLRTRFVAGGGAVGPEELTVFVAPSSKGFTVAEPDQWQTPLPGFAFGIDLRLTTKLAVVIDTGPGSCAALASHDAWSPRPQVEAALAGLPPEAAVSLFVGAGTDVAESRAGSAAERAAMAHAVTGLPCGPRSGGIAAMLARAFAGHPDVVIAISRFDDKFDPKRFETVAPVVAISLARGNPLGPLLAADTGGVAVTAAPR